MSTLLRKHDFDEVFDGQKVFRLILEAMSYPMAVVNIKEYADKLYGGYPALMAVALTLLDNEVSFCVCEDDELADEIASLTLSKKEEPEDADFIFVLSPGDLRNAIENAKCGTLADPHKSATIIIQNDGSSQLLKDAILLRDEQNYEYPQGIDLLFISEGGELYGICRGVRRQ